MSEPMVVIPGSHIGRELECEHMYADSGSLPGGEGGRIIRCVKCLRYEHIPKYKYFSERFNLIDTLTKAEEHEDSKERISRAVHRWGLYVHRP